MRTLKQKKPQKKETVLKYDEVDQLKFGGRKLKKRTSKKALMTGIFLWIK